MKRLLLFAFLLSQTLSAQQLTWPEITKENKPWTRWWWPGSIVNKADLTAAMEKYSKAGLGGMEIAVIYGVKGQEDKFINYLSPRWMEMFTYTLAESKRLGMGIDLANASGWPFGGPWVDPQDASRNINYKTWSIKGGETVSEKIEFIQKPLVRPVGQKPDITKLTEPIGSNKDLQLYALDQIRFEKALPLTILMAYSDSGQVINLTRSVNKTGKLDWTAPPGSWTLYALFEGWHGKQAERAGPGGEGDVIDHFSGRAINNYLKHFDAIFKDYDVNGLRGYFNDSYEVDDASGQADWTNDLFNEFRIRRGYDLGMNLPALFQKDDPEKNERVLSDYRQTISDLILEKFTMSWTAWAHKQGKTTRNQAHGSPGNILDLYAASDIPETEGSELTKLKFASSAANVTGKKYASAEAATWLNEHFLSSLSDVKNAVDQFFLGGINHVFYHGTCFSPQNEPWPGFLFYAAVEFTPANSFWNDFPALNSYISHVQSFLQQGKADNDILLYFPVFDRYADYGRGMLEHFDAISPAFKGTPFKSGVDIMIEKGYAFDYISDLQLKNTGITNELLETEGNRYKTLIIPGCQYIPITTFTQILKLANDGASIIFLGSMPEKTSGWYLQAEKEKLFIEIKNSIPFKTTSQTGIKKADLGSGSIIIGNDLPSLLNFAGIRREQMADNGIQFSRRLINGGACYFIKNKSDKIFNGWLPLSIRAGSAAIFNPYSADFGTAKLRKNGDSRIEIFTRLKPGESQIIKISDKKIAGEPFPFYDPASAPLEIAGTWSVDFVEGGPVLPPPVRISTLKTWTEFGGEQLKDFSGTATYKINFRRPATNSDAWQLQLGKVFNSVRVTLNGKELATLIGPDYSVIIDKSLILENNTLELKVSNLMANRIAYLDRNKIGWKKFYNVNMAARLKENNKNGLFDASHWLPLESGLIGPVTLTPVRKMK